MVPDALVVPLMVCAAAAFCCWLLAVVVDEYSWVDRLWSIIPAVYLWIFAGQSDFSDARLNLMAVLVTAWAARLTFNYARKGGYAKGGEDYRWSILKGRMSKVQWHLFNFFFIATYQNVLLLLIALPAFTASQHKTPLSVLDVIAAIVFVVFLIGEFVADQQQWNFHKQKKAGDAAAVQKGFVDTGLWSWSRHPNFFFEQAQWWVVYAFACIASGEDVVHATVVGPVLLVLLFQGSAKFTESITAAKYPAYADYQRRVSQTIPLPPRA